MPSTRNITRQPASPAMPWPVEMTQEESGEPTAVEIGTAAMKSAVIRARSFCGNQ